jgi:AcrR family transcriptional regulator
MAEAALSRRERQRIETRTELVAAAHAIVKDDGYEALTIRKLAERVGLATMSVYSYFADKQAILTAVAEDTFEILARRIEKKEPPDPIDALKVGLREYVLFGMENPNEYRTIFMTPQVHEHEDESFEQLEAQNPAFQGLLRAVNAAIDAKRLQGDARAISTILWTVSHGAVSLMLTFHKYPFGEPVEYAGRVIDLTIEALATSSVPPLCDSNSRC